MYAAILSPKGKILHDLIAYRIESQGAAQDQGVLIEVDAHGKTSLLDLLARWKYTVIYSLCIQYVKRSFS